MYNYSKLKEELFTDLGQRTFLKVRDRVFRLLEKSGAITMHMAIINVGFGNQWFQMACVDRMVELKEIIEIEQAGKVASQNRIFIKP